MESQHELDTNSPSDDVPPVEIILDESASIEVTGTLSQCHPKGMRRLNLHNRDVIQVNYGACIYLQ